MSASCVGFNRHQILSTGLRFDGHLPNGPYDVDHGGHTIEATAASAATGERETLGAYPHQGPWLESEVRLKNIRDERHERFEAVAVSYQNYDGDGKRLEVVLIEQESHATSTGAWKFPAPRPLVPA